ncbi:condensation domain-containing protein [Paenibacillus rhizoplanae]
MQLGLFRTGSGDHLLIAIHHLVVDGVSWRILLEDFAAGYEQRLHGEPVALPGKNAFLPDVVGADRELCTEPETAEGSCILAAGRRRQG